MHHMCILSRLKMYHVAIKLILLGHKGHVKLAKFISFSSGTSFSDSSEVLIFAVQIVQGTPNKGLLSFSFFIS